MRWLLIVLLSLAALSSRADAVPYQRQPDVIYGRTFGTALTMDVFQPVSGRKNRAIVLVISGGWGSYKDESFDRVTIPEFIEEPVRHGYTVFAVFHASQPKYAIDEIHPQIARAVRFIRYHASDYQIDPDHVGIGGGSAAGHLALLQAVDPTPEDPKSDDPVDRVSSRVQASAVLCPPTDFLNYGAPGVDAIGKGVMGLVKGAFDFKVQDGFTKEFHRVTDPAKIREIGRAISPAYHVSPDDPPTLIIHGEKDEIVPPQQVHLMMEKFASVHVPHRLILKTGMGHGWAHHQDDVQNILKWFDEYLCPEPATTAVSARN